MIITCPECLTKFRLDEERIPDGGTKARCSKCRHVFQVQKPTAAEESFFSREESPGPFNPQEEEEFPLRKRFSWSKGLALGIAALVIAGVLIFSLGKSGTGTAKGFFSTMGDYLADKATSLKKISLPLPFVKKHFGAGEQADGFFSLEKVRGYYLENSPTKTFIIEGEAVNHWKESRSFIKVKGTLLDTKGNKVQERTAYCGNILSEKDLKEMSRESFEKTLSSQFGVSFSNVNILPEKSVPFMIVFTDLPADSTAGQPAKSGGGKTGEPLPGLLSDFTIEIAGSQKGSK